MSRQSNQFEDVAFVGTTRQEVRELAEFDKQTHSIPKKVDQYSSKFAGKVAAKELEDDLENVFQKLREAFRFKRKELDKSTPEIGCGSIATPHFIYAINVSLNPDNPAVVFWERSIINVTSPDEIVCEGFARVFDNMFDRIEFALSPPIELEDWIDKVEDLEDERLTLNYDSDATHCTLQIEDVDAKIEVTESSVAVVHSHFDQTRHILASFLEAKKALGSSLVS